MMTERRNLDILEIIERRTAQLVGAGPQACRDHLIALGTHNMDGSLHADHGGTHSEEAQVPAQ